VCLRLCWKHARASDRSRHAAERRRCVLRKIVVDLCAQLRHESSEKDKYRSLLRELLDAQRNRKSEKLSKEQLALFEEIWKASDPEEEDESVAEQEQDKPEEPQAKQA
jgi:hypothetical protein